MKTRNILNIPLAQLYNYKNNDINWPFQLAIQMQGGKNRVKLPNTRHSKLKLNQ